MVRYVVRIAVSVAVCVAVMFGAQAANTLSASAAEAPAPVTVGNFVIKGPILVRYLAVGGEATTGAPLDNEIQTAPRTGIDGVFQPFENGVMFWSQQTGARWVHNGPLLDAFMQCAFFCFGMPTSDVLNRANGGTVLLTQYGGNLYARPGMPVYQVYGAILAKYDQMGGTTSLLGFPTSDVRTSSNGLAELVSFQWGVIVWSQETGAHEVHGAIRARWNQLGSLQSSLGLPTSDEHSVPGGRQSDFQHGSIFWNASTGTTTVTMNP